MKEGEGARLNHIYKEFNFKLFLDVKSRESENALLLNEKTKRYYLLQKKPDFLVLILFTT